MRGVCLIAKAGLNPISNPYPRQRAAPRLVDDVGKLLTAEIVLRWAHLARAE